MKREVAFACPAWDDPFWHVVRMLVDQKGLSSDLSAKQIIPYLVGTIATDASWGLARYLEARPAYLEPLADYLSLRIDVANRLLALARTEEAAIADHARLSQQAVRKYGTQLEGHHQSPKVLVATVEVLTIAACAKAGLPANVSPQQRATVVADDHIWVSPRRLDGALPGLFNPVALWEIKEYWGKTKGGSKMSDAIYECQLVGAELRNFQNRYGTVVRHYAILDGVEQWSARRADLRRAVDLLYSGLLDELIVGREVLTEWPRIADELCVLATDLSRATPRDHTTWF